MFYRRKIKLFDIQRIEVGGRRIPQILNEECIPFGVHGPGDTLWW